MWKMFAATLLLSLPAFAQGGKTTILVMETNKGTIEFALWPDIAPKAVENITKHAQEGYYDGIRFHRIIPKFMIQGGDPTGTGTSGKSIWGEPFEDECSTKVTFDRPGLLAMANAGPNTNGSQFFITTAPTPWLNGRHTIFGEVTKGYDVVEQLEAVGSQTGATREEVKILKMSVQ